MSAVVGGNAWSAGGVAGSPAAATYEYSAADTSILIVGHRIYADGSGSSVTLFTRTFAGPGTHPLARVTNATLGGQASFKTYTAAPVVTTTCATDATYTGTLTGTLFDLIHRDIKGSFSFTGYDAVSVALTNVTSGSFDVSFS